MTNLPSKTFIIRENKSPTDPKLTRSTKCWYVTHNEEGGYMEDEVEFEEHKDGTLCVSNGNAWVFLNSSQVEVLRRFLMGEPQLED